MNAGKLCKRLCFLFFLFCIPFARAQQANLKFRSVSLREGLAQSPVTSLFQDNQGFIWIGNWKGLNRYDGNAFRTFKHSDGDSTTLSNNRVNAIYQDKANKLWIATANGLSIFEPKTEKFSSIFDVNIKGGKNYVSGVTADKKGNIWISTFSGLKLISNSRMQDITLTGSPDLSRGVLFTLCRDGRDRIWAGTKQGPVCFDPNSRKLLTLPDVIKNNTVLRGARIVVIREDKLGNIWFGTERSGVFKLDLLNSRLTSFSHSDNNPASLSSDWVKDILFTRSGKVWIGTRSGISQLQDDGSFINFRHQPGDPGSIHDSTIWSLMEDSSGNLWIGTFAGGISLLQHGGNNFSNIGERVGNNPGLNHPVVNAVVEDKDGSWWIGTYGGGINQVNLKTGAYHYYLLGESTQDRPTNGIKSMSQDEQGNLWIGTLSGLYRFNKTTRAVKYISFPLTEGKLSGNLINTVLADIKGVWAGTNGGGLRFVSYEGAVSTYRHLDGDDTSLSDDYITSLIKDEKGNLWVGTQNGLNYFDTRKNKFTLKIRRNKQFPISHNTILTLFIDSKRRFWIGTEGGGLNYYDRRSGRIFSLSAAAGITDDVIHAIREDKAGDLWISSDAGLFRLSTANMKVPLKEHQLHIRAFNARDGLASNQFSTNAALCAANGMMLFGGVNGLTFFNPQKLLTNAFVPPVVLTGFTVRNVEVPVGDENSPLKQAINYTSRLSLDYGERFISIKFACLNYINPTGNQFAYKLEGLTGKEDWHYSGNESVATYTNLGPGKYTFMVKAANNDGVWNQDPVKLQITVLPPWWMSWWAYLIYTLILGAAIFGIVRFFYVRSRLRRKLFLEQLHNERQQELYQMKLNFFTNISHEIRTPLTLIIGPLDKLIQSVISNNGMHRQLLMVKNNADRLMRLVTELLDFRKVETGNLRLHYYECNMVRFAEEIFLSFQALALSRNINYRFDAEVPELTACFDKDQMEKVLFNLLSNAFKFTADHGNIHVSLRKSQAETINWLHISVEDDGPGIAAEEQGRLFEAFFQADDHKSHLGTGIGLALSKSIVELHKGELKVESRQAVENQAGKTVFTVSLRMDREHTQGAGIIPEYMNSENPAHYKIQSELELLTEPPETDSQAKKYTVLIIEDNDEVRQFISASLAGFYHITESPDGSAGLEDAFRIIPDLIISDVMMPGTDGLELCRIIKSDERTNHIPVILLTARAAYIHQLNGLENGADAYITKPFSIQILELQVRNLLESKEAIRKKYRQELVLQPKNISITSPEEKFLTRLMEIIELNMENDQFGVQELVAEIGMSKTVLYKKVKALTDLPVADYIKSVRLQKAAMLLVQNQLTIAEIAFSVGFTDRKYFSKEFRKQYGLSPTEYISAQAEKEVF